MTSKFTAQESFLPTPNRIALDLRRVMRTKYRIDDYQQTYFVIDSFESLLEQTLEADFGPLYAELDGAEMIEPATIEPADHIFTRGTQAYAQSRAAKD
jgi:phenylalanine-4-hydroxylase